MGWRSFDIGRSCLWLAASGSTWEGLLYGIDTGLGNTIRSVTMVSRIMEIFVRV